MLDRHHRLGGLIAVIPSHTFGYVGLQLERAAIALRFCKRSKNGAGSTSTTARGRGARSPETWPSGRQIFRRPLPRALGLCPQTRKTDRPRAR